MVVVMRPGAVPGEVDAVVDRVESAGGSAFVSRGVQRTIVGLVGDVVAFEGLNLRAMPGVGEVVRVSKAYKLVSRENHPDASIITVGERADVHLGP
ncbi:MAG: 3-deoxy-7-phosphoheptulonate synthase, partial [Actinomycetota bacterium]|nr:3-deoxy-7-phosphoheptulonate synthase [Actinomycetota bacterium]